MHELQRTDERRSELLATISHEIRTPLTSVRGYAQLVAGGDAGPVTPEQREFLGIIERSALQLAEMVDSILDVEGFEATGQWSSGRTEAVPVARLFQEVKTVALVLAREKKLASSIFLVGKGAIEPLLREKAALLQEKKKDEGKKG